MKVSVRRPGGDITIEISRTYGRGHDLVALARHWYYALLVVMWTSLLGDVLHLIGRLT